MASSVKGAVLLSDEAKVRKDFVPQEFLLAALGGSITDNDYLAMASEGLLEHQRRESCRRELPYDQYVDVDESHKLKRRISSLLPLKRAHKLGSFRFENIDMLSKSGYLELEHGYTFLPNRNLLSGESGTGVWFIAILSDMGEVTGEMYKWWINFCDENHKFAWSHPYDNKSCVWDTSFYAVQPEDRVVVRMDGSSVNQELHTITEAEEEEEEAEENEVQEKEQHEKSTPTDHFVGQKFYCVMNLSAASKNSHHKRGHSGKDETYGEFDGSTTDGDGEEDREDELIDLEAGRVYGSGSGSGSGSSGGSVVGFTGGSSLGTSAVAAGNGSGSGSGVSVGNSFKSNNNNSSNRPHISRSSSTNSNMSSTSTNNGGNSSKSTYSFKDQLIDADVIVSAGAQNLVYEYLNPNDYISHDTLIKQGVTACLVKKIYRLAYANYESAKHINHRIASTSQNMAEKITLVSLSVPKIVHIGYMVQMMRKTPKGRNELRTRLWINSDHGMTTSVVDARAAREYNSNNNQGTSVSGDSEQDDTSSGIFPSIYNMLSSFFSGSSSSASSGDVNNSTNEVVDSSSVTVIDPTSSDLDKNANNVYSRSPSSFSVSPTHSRVDSGATAEDGGGGDDTSSDLPGATLCMDGFGSSLSCLPAVSSLNLKRSDLRKLIQHPSNNIAYVLMSHFNEENVAIKSFLPGCYRHHHQHKMGEENSSSSSSSGSSKVVTTAKTLTKAGSLLVGSLYEDSSSEEEEEEEEEDEYGDSVALDMDKDFNLNGVGVGVGIDEKRGLGLGGNNNNKPGVVRVSGKSEPVEKLTIAQLQSQKQTIKQAEIKNRFVQQYLAHKEAEKEKSKSKSKSTIATGVVATGAVPPASSPSSDAAGALPKKTSMTKATALVVTTVPPPSASSVEASSAATATTTTTTTTSSGSSSSAKANTKANSVSKPSYTVTGDIKRDSTAAFTTPVTDAPGPATSTAGNTNSSDLVVAGDGDDVADLGGSDPDTASTGRSSFFGIKIGKGSSSKTNKSKNAPAVTNSSALVAADADGVVADLGGDGDGVDDRDRDRDEDGGANTSSSNAGRSSFFGIKIGSGKNKSNKTGTASSTPTPVPAPDAIITVTDTDIATIADSFNPSADANADASADASVDASADASAGVLTVMSESDNVEADLGGGSGSSSSSGSHAVTAAMPQAEGAETETQLVIVAEATEKEGAL